MLPPEEYERAAREADYHVQIAIQSVEFQSDHAIVQGPVLRVFRGPTALCGSIMRVNINCFSPQQINDWPPDGMRRFSVDALVAGRTLEALIVQAAAGPIIAADLCVLLESATDVPQLE